MYLQFLAKLDSLLNESKAPVAGTRPASAGHPSGRPGAVRAAREEASTLEVSQVRLDLSRQLSVQGQTVSTERVEPVPLSVRPDATADADTPETAEQRLDDADRSRLRGLRARDEQVRADRSAQAAAAGDLAVGGPRYRTQRGADGKVYAVAGEVDIATSEGRDARQTLERAERARRAALATLNPTANDIATAVRAARLAADARAQLARDRPAPGEPPTVAGHRPISVAESAYAAVAEDEVEPVEG